MAEMDKYIFGIIGVFTAVYGWLIRHLFNKCQFKDVCEATHEGLKETLEAKFGGLTKLMEQQFKDLGELVKKNGGQNA